MLRLALVLSLIPMLGGPSAMANGSPIAEGLILIEETETGLRVEGVVLGHGDAQVSARLQIVREGPSGSVNTTQGRVVQTQAGSRDTVASVGLSFDADSTLDAVLILEQGGEEFARTDATLPLTDTEKGEE